MNGNDIPEDIGSLVDRELGNEQSEILPERTKTTPKGGAPTLDEWQKFFSRIVIRFLTDGYIAFAFRGIDEDSISERDYQRLKLTQEERGRIAVPFSEYANKSSFARKHGRKVVAAADSFESMATLAIWMGRVNRIARKYRPKTQKGKAPHVSPGQAEQNGHGDASTIDGDGVHIFNPNI